MRASPSDNRVRLAVMAAVGALVLAGCSSGSDDVSTEPAVSLAPETTTAGTAPAATASALPDDDVTDDPTDDAVDDSTVLAGASTVIDNSAQVEVEDQAGDGSAVQVESVRIGAEPGFVVIYDAGQTVLGWEYVPSAVRGVTVSLSTPVQASRELVAALFRDDGDKEFDASVDPLIVEEDDDGTETEPVAEDFDYVLR